MQPRIPKSRCTAHFDIMSAGGYEGFLVVENLWGTVTTSTMSATSDKVARLDKVRQRQDIWIPRQASQSFFDFVLHQSLEGPVKH
jgi:hypothetical protein